MIRVMIVDDHELVRSGIARVLQDAPDIEVVAQADSGESALSMIRQASPDVVLMDVNMPGIGGLEATRKLLAAQTGLKIIAVTVHADGPFPSRLLQAGASGYLTKGCAVKEIMGAIRTVARGQRYIGTEVAQNMALSMTSEMRDSPFDILSQRELQVVLMIIQGLKPQEISDRLCLSPKTISTYRHRIFEKLSIHSDVDLTHLAMRYGLMNEELTSAGGQGIR